MASYILYYFLFLVLWVISILSSISFSFSTFYFGFTFSWSIMESMCSEPIFRLLTFLLPLLAFRSCKQLGGLTMDQVDYGATTLLFLSIFSWACFMYSFPLEQSWLVLSVRTFVQLAFYQSGLGTVFMLGNILYFTTSLYSWTLCLFIWGRFSFSSSYFIWDYQDALICQQNGESKRSQLMFDLSLHLSSLLFLPCSRISLYLLSCSFILLRLTYLDILMDE